MKTPLPFRPKAPSPPLPWWDVDPWSVHLAKDGRRRLYAILPGGQRGAVQAWVRFDGTPHRARLIRSVAELELFRAQFAREIAELQRDGWQLR